MEANPGTAEAASFAGFRDAGVNRLSIGAQSLKDSELQWLERIHHATEVWHALEMARTAGFGNVNLDLMYGLPDQDPDDWLETLDLALGMDPEHLSCYQLTVEPKTRLAARHRQQPLALPDEELSRHFFLATRRRLRDAGYQVYEISNFARPGFHCRHNDAYWLYHDYLGIGAGAAGKWDSEDGGVIRYTNLSSPAAYMHRAHSNGCAIGRQESLPLKKAAAEAIWLGLRRSKGIELAEYGRRFAASPHDLFGSQLSSWIRAGKLDDSTSHLRLHEEGLLHADTLAADILAAA